MLSGMSLECVYALQFVLCVRPACCVDMLCHVLHALDAHTLELTTQTPPDVAGQFRPPHPRRQA